MNHLVNRFYEKAKDYASRIPKSVLETIYTKVSLLLKTLTRIYSTGR